MNNSYKVFEEWVEKLGWFKLSQDSKYSRWITPQGNAVVITLQGDLTLTAEMMVCDD